MGFIAAPNPPSNRPPQPRLWRRITSVDWSDWLLRQIGIQGKVLIALMSMLIAALAASSWVWTTKSDQTISELVGEQAQQITYALAHAAQPSMDKGHADSLKRIASDLVGARDVVFIGFYDAHGQNLCFTHSVPNSHFNLPELTPADMQSLGRVQRRTFPIFGEVLQAGSPIVSTAPAPDALPNSPPVSRIVGYVVMGMSPVQERLQIHRVTTIAKGLGCIIVLLSLPVSFLLVHRIFGPIRELVWATEQIAAGKLETRVATDRHDAIGDLARSFNEMVNTVKQQREDLQHVNERLAAANDELEEKVVQRTGQLEAANRRLSNEIAEKEDFLRAVSHDLNAPLRNISGMAAMLLMKHREKFDEDIIHRLERIQKNVETETDLIGELLELSRIKTRRQKMEMVEIAGLVKDLEEMFENDLRSHGIALIVDTPLPVLHCERPRFRQVFQNLIDNAIKYMGTGPTREIHVGCTINPNEAEFYVRDTGVGIEPDDIGKVFFVFRRGKGPATQNVPGKGVGLASVKSIIETYSGTIRVESELGRGTTFRFTINGQYVPGAQQIASALKAGNSGEKESGALELEQEQV